jgi:hypothetical protein
MAMLSSRSCGLRIGGWLGSIAVAAWLWGLGCSMPRDAAGPATTPTATSESAQAVGQTRGEQAVDSQDLLRQIDDALDYTFHHRRLSVGQGPGDQAAWQIIHGAMAFGREFLVRHEGRDVPVIDYILRGGRMKGLDLRQGDLLDPATGRYGVTTVVPEDKMGQGHVDQWLGYLSECGLKLDEPLVVEGRQHTFADYLEQARRDVYKNARQEFSWTLMALTAYYPTDDRWTAGDGSEWSIEKLVEIELGHDLEASPCGGTHRMMGLTVAFNRHRAAGKPVTGVWQQVAERIDDCVQRARRFQNPDGSLSSNYFARPGKSADLAVCMGSAGHVLEFLAAALDPPQLSQPWVQRATLDVCKLFRKTKPVDVECGALFHAAHGLVLYREKVFGRRSFAAQVAQAPSTK